jgi:hypothetical protein
LEAPPRIEAAGTTVIFMSLKAMQEVYSLSVSGANLNKSGIPSDLLRWLPGPILDLEMRSRAVQAVAADLTREAGRGKLHRPATWLRVAKNLGIGTSPYYAAGESAGRLLYSAVGDSWIITYNVARRPIAQAGTLVHELAHWYWREAPGEWLCGEPVVYYYEGPVEDERHRLARDVEKLLVPRMHVAPPEGLFREGTGG